MVPEQHPNSGALKENRSIRPPRTVALVQYLDSNPMKCFVPITDELLYDTPAEVIDELVPYHTDYPCYHWLIDDSFGLTDFRNAKTEAKAEQQD